MGDLLGTLILIFRPKLNMDLYTFRLRRLHQEDHEADAVGLPDDRQDRGRADAREGDGPPSQPTK